MEIVVFTNGCFDLIHQGHIDLLKNARSLGTRLIVGLNSDDSVQSIKGSPRPFIEQTARAAILKEMRSVDEVRIFNENTPEKLIREIKPDILVKGGDWTFEQIVGADFVLKNGGKVISIPFENDISSSKLVEKIKVAEKYPAPAEIAGTGTANLVESSLKEQLEVFQVLINQEISNITKCAEMIFETLSKGNKVLLCGDLENEFASEKLATQLQAICKRKGNSPSSTAVINLTLAGETSTKVGDAEQQTIFRQIEKIAKEADLLIALSSSKNSLVVTETVMKARQAGCRTIGLTDLTAKKLISLCDAGISLSVRNGIRIKTAQDVVCQIWCEIIEEKISDSINFQNGYIR